MGNKEDNFSFLYEKALDLISGKRLQDGKEILENLYALGNINKDVLNVLGILSYLYCNFEDAKKYWTESLDIYSCDNEAAKFIEDLGSEEFNILEGEYYKSIDSIECRNYRAAINILERIIEKRSELIEAKELLALLYMLENKKYRAFDIIKVAADMDKANDKLSLIYENIKADTKSESINVGSIEQFTVSEVVLNLIMILNYKINEFYEDEYRLRNEEILRLKQLLVSKDNEIEGLKLEHEEALEIIEAVRFRNESAYTEEIEFE